MYNIILTQKQQKYHHYHLEKLINVNILQVKKEYLSIKEVKEQAMYTNSPIGEALEKQTKRLRIKEKSK